MSLEKLIRDYQSVINEVESLAELVIKLQEFRQKITEALLNNLDPYVRREFYTPGKSKVYELHCEFIKIDYQFPKLDLQGVDPHRLMAGLVLSDIVLSRKSLTVSTSDVKLGLTMCMCYAQLPEITSKKITFYVYPHTLVLTRNGPSLNLRFVIYNVENLYNLLGRPVRELLTKLEENYEISEVPEEVYQYLKNSRSIISPTQFVKELKIVTYVLNKFIGRETMVTWYFGDGVAPHENSLDVGISMKVSDIVLNYLNSYLSNIYNIDMPVLRGSGTSNVKYFVCPAKKLFLDDVVKLCGKWPHEVLVERVVKVLNNLKYVYPCYQEEKWPVVNVLGVDFRLHRVGSGRGKSWFLIKCSSDLSEVVELRSRLLSLGLSNVNVIKQGNNHCLTIGVDDTRKILSTLGLLDKFYSSSCSTCIDLELLKDVLGKYVRKWYSRVEEGVNGSGYRYRSECIYLSTGDSVKARKLRSELEKLGISVRKVQYGTVIVCRGEHVTILKQVLDRSTLTNLST